VSGRRCASCGTLMSAFTSGSLCVLCHTKDADAAVVPVPARAPRGTAWLWVSPAAASALATRDLGVILRTYRAVNHVSQRRLAEQLGYDPAGHGCPPSKPSTASPARHSSAYRRGSTPAVPALRALAHDRYIKPTPVLPRVMACLATIEPGPQPRPVRPHVGHGSGR
jgi:hypothetical protein